MRTSTTTIRRAHSYDLTTDVLYRLLKLRVEVFVVEQRCAYPELDGRDLERDARHYWIESGDEIICTLRLLEEHEDGVKSYRIGRLCTQPDYRGQGHTRRVLQAALAEVGSTPCRILSPTYLADVYAEYGFVPAGPDVIEDGIPHRPMERIATKR